MNDKQMRLLGSLVAALIVASGLGVLATLPTATAASGPAPDVVYDAGTGAFTGGSLVYGMTRDLIVTGIACGPLCIEGSEYVLLYPGEDVDPQPGRGTWNSSQRGTAPNTLQVTFDGITFDRAGDWRVMNRQTQAVAATIPVAPRQYQLDPVPALTYDQDGRPGIILKLFYLDDAGKRQPAKYADISVLYGTTLVDAGRASQSGELLIRLDFTATGAGTYRVEAQRAESNDDIPDYRTLANDAGLTFRVLPGPLGILKVSGAAESGFPATLRLNVTTPEGIPVLPGQAGTTFLLRNATTGVVNATRVTRTADNLTQVSFIPVAGHAYQLVVTYSAAPDAAADYEGTFPLLVNASPPMRLAASPATLDVRASTGDAAASLESEFRLTVTGDTHTKHPGWTDADAKLNISVSGNTLYPSVVRAIDAARGVYGVTVFPYRGGENVTVTVTWNGVVKVLTVPVNGLRATVDRTQVVVDQDTPLRVTVTDAAGNRVTSAHVTLFAASPGGSTKIGELTGDGSTDRGANGVYSLVAAPTNLTDVLVMVRDGTAYGYATLRAIPAHDLQVTLTPDGPFLEGQPLQISGAVTLPPNNKPFGGVTLYLLNQTQYETFAHAHFEAPTAFLANFTRGTPGAYAFTLPAGLPAGTYYVYAVEPGQHDNLDTAGLPSFTVGAGILGFTQPSLVVGTDEQRNVGVTLRVGSVVADVSGTLHPQGPGAAPGGEVRLVNGRATFTAGSVLTPGAWTYTFTPDTGRTLNVTGSIIVELARIVLSPEDLYVYESNHVVATVTSPTSGEPIPGARVRLEQGNLVAQATTDASGQAVLEVSPITNSPVSVTVNGVQLLQVTPHSALNLKFDAPNPVYTPGQRVTGVVLQRSFSPTPVPNATLTVNGETVRSGADGRFVFNASLTPGVYNVTASAPTFRKAAVSAITVSSSASGPVADLRLGTPVVTVNSGHALDSLVEGDTVVVTVEVTNVGGALGTLPLKLLKNGTVVETTMVSLAGNERNTYRIEHTFTAAGTYTLTVNDQHPVSVTVRASTTPGTQVKPKFDPNEEPGIPGFEAVAALAALGAALLVLRRRAA